MLSTYRWLASAILVVFFISSEISLSASLSRHDQDLDSEAMITYLRQFYPEYFYPESDLVKRYNEYAFGLGKRPDYSFGLGKRQYTFGLGKKSSNPYNFGLGKRSTESKDSELIQKDEEQHSRHKRELNSIKNDNVYGNLSPSDAELLYDYYDEFGLLPSNFGDMLLDPAFKLRSDTQNQGDGKRSTPYSFGLGKRADVYSFGLGKRQKGPFSFGLGKRKSDPFSFGLGKRKSQPFSFGLGRRGAVPYKNELTQPYYSGDIMDKDATSYTLGNSKARLPFSFGLGKRTYDFGLGKRETTPYSFGLGKRTYSFGLGKRTYSFGLGKRSGDQPNHDSGNEDQVASAS